MAIGVKQILDYDDYAAIPQRQLEDYFEARGIGRVVLWM